MMKIKQGLFIGLLSCITISLSAKESWELKSPDGNLRVSFGVNEGRMTWEVDYKDQSVLLPSQLGIMGYENEMSVVSTRESGQDTVWKPIYGERSQVRDRYNSRFIELEKRGNRHRLGLEFRAYDQGIAFRYHLLEHPGGGQYVHIRREATRFTLPEGTKAWFTSFAQGLYQLLPLADWPGEAERPLTLELPNGLYACLAEAEMVNYSRTKFVLDKEKPNTIACAMYGEVDEITPFVTPWRVVMAAERAGDLLENNDLILNLNPPCEVEQTWWIRPGKVMRDVTLSTDGGKRLVDFAVKHNIQYIHLDAGWYGHEYEMASDATTVSVDPRRNPKGDLNLKEVVEYAKRHDVGVFLYVNQRALARQLDELLPLFRSWGISGIKFGFVQVGSHRWTTWMHDAVRKCAEYGLMVNIHDEYRPTGFSRTYPNLMTQEGIRGNEEMPSATHNTILPFTRFIAGAADYTICYYHQKHILAARGADVSRGINTTSAHQLALSMIYYSPLQWMYWYDRPEDCQDEPELAFFDAVPTVWDDTKVLSGRPGESAVLARRGGDQWFVGGITNNDARTITVDFGFLPEGVTYLADIYTDGSDKIPTRTKVKVDQRKIKAGEKMQFSLKASGGFAMKLKPL